LVLSHPGEVERLTMEDLARLMQDPSRTGSAEYRVASEGYFRAMGIPLIRGRLFDERDGPDAPHAAVISRSLAEGRWPGEDPIGKVIEFGNMDGDLRPFTVVGIVGDVRERGIDAEPQPTLYGHHRQRTAASSGFSIVVAAPGDAAPVVAAARGLVRELDPGVPPRF